MQTSSPLTWVPGGDRLPGVVVDVDLHAETAALQLAAPHGQRGRAEREAGHDVGAAGDRRQAEVVLHALVDVIEALGRERAARREQRPQVREREVLARDDADLLRVVDVLGGRAEVGDPLGFREIPQHLAAVDEGRPVVEQQRRAGGEPGREPVPHHPAAGREIEQPVTRLEVAVQQVFLDVLQQRAAGAVDDALRHAGRPRRKEDVHGMIERQPGVLDRRGRRRADERVPRDGAADGREVLRAEPRVREIRNHDHALDGGQPRDDRGHLVEDRQRLAVVPVAVDREEHARLDLAEAVEHALHAEIRRARREDRAEARGAQHRVDHLGHVGDVRGDAISRRDARGLQRRRHARRRRHQIRVRDAADEPVLAAEHQRIARVVGRAAREQVLREIEACVGKPSRAGHARGVDERALAACPDDAGVSPTPRARTPRARRSTSARARHSREASGRTRARRAARTR